MTLVLVRADVFERFVTGCTGETGRMEALVGVDDATNDRLIACAT